MGYSGYTGPAPMGYAIVPPNDRMKELAEKRIDIVKRMTEALFEYLTFSERLTLETFNDPVEISPPPCMYTVEDLVRAQSNREALQTQIDQFETAISEFPRTGKTDLMITMMEAGMLTPLKMQLQQCDDYVARVQAELDRAARVERNNEEDQADQANNT